MADIVNAQDAGYSKLDLLVDIHDDILTELQAEIESIKNLIGEGNGFYAESTCNKINTLLDSVDNQMFSGIKDAFSRSEKAVSTMENMLKSEDHF